MVGIKRIKTEINIVRIYYEKFASIRLEQLIFLTLDIL